MLDRELVRSVDRAASLLIALGDANGEAGVTELGRRLGFNKSTASRLLATLEIRGLVVRTDQSRKYRLGPAVVRLGVHAEGSLDLSEIARPELESLASAVSETATLEILRDDSVLTIACSDGPSSGCDRTGRHSPIHASAPGKVLLASRPERDVIRLSRVRFTPYTSHTIVRVDQLLRELARVRQRGFSTAFGEQEPAVNSIAVPVFDRRSGVVAALEIRGLGTRITPSRVPELVERAQASAAVITDRIGGVTADLNPPRTAYRPGSTSIPTRARLQAIATSRVVPDVAGSTRPARL